MGNEQKENKLSKAVLENKIKKYGITRKTFYSAGSVVVCILLIIVLSITQATFNTDSISTLTFWIDFAILSGLSIYGMISGRQTGDDISRNNPNGAYRASLNKYGTAFSKIDALMLFAYFDRWLEIYREKKINKKIESILKDNGVHQMEVLKLDLTELEKLNSPFKKTWPETGKDTYFLTYTKEQIELIKYCMSGKVKVSKLPRSFFVDAFYNSEKDMWESAAKSNKKKGAYLGFNYLYRILILLVMCIISAGLAPGHSAGTREVVLSLAKRIFGVVTAFVWGIFVGFEMVKIDITYLNFKTDILNTYFEECKLEIYKPQTIEEEAKNNYNNSVKNEEVENDGGNQEQE